MNISWLIPPSGGNFAGIEQVTFRLATEMSREDASIDIILAEHIPDFPSVPKSVNTFQLGAHSITSSVWPLVKYLRQRAPDVLVVAQVSMGTVSVLARWMAGVSTRIILVQHGTASIEARESWKAQLLYQLGYVLFPSQISRVIAVSRGVAEDFTEECSYPDDQVSVVYNPVIGNDFSARENELPKHPWFEDDHDVPLIVGAGRLHPSKDFRTLIRAFDRVKDLRDARLLILGEGEEREQIEKIVAERDLEMSVSLPGYVDNPFPYMKGGDIFVLSSAWEGLGNVLIEAIATGTPAVSTDCPHGPSEILGEGQWGRLVDVGDADAMAKAILATLDEGRSEREELKKRAKEFTVENAVCRYEKLIYEYVNS